MTTEAQKQQQQAIVDTQPRVVDDDMGGIDVIFNGLVLRGWCYMTDDERRTKMLCAREYIEGWCDGRETR